MKQHSIGVVVREEANCLLKHSWLRKIIRSTLNIEGVMELTEVDLLMTSNKEMRRLNKQYRGVNNTTDVLSFALEESVAFPKIPSQGQLLGQVVVSYPQASKQAGLHKHSVEREVAFLVVHGLLHLMGYDHQQPEDQATMESHQELIMSKLGFRRK